MTAAAEPSENLIELDTPDEVRARRSRRQAMPKIDAPAPESPFCLCDPAPYRARRDAAGNATSVPLCSVCFKPNRPRRAAPARTASETTSDVTPIAPVEVETISTRPGRQAIPVVRDAAADRAETAQVARAMTAGQLVAGATAGASGIILAWSGVSTSRGLSHGAIVEVLAESGCPAEWAPRVPGAATQLAHTMGKFNRSGRVVRSVPDVSPGIESRWVVGTIDSTASAGAPMGSISLTVTMHETSDALTFDGDDELAAEIERDYRARLAAAQHTNSQVSDWITKILRQHNAQAMGGWSVFYVPAAHVATITALVMPLARRFGNWMPPIPVATCDEIRAALSRTFGEEVAEECEKLALARAALEPGKELKSVSAVAFQRRLRALAERVVHYMAVLGEAFIAPLRDQINTALTSLDGALSDTSLRFEMIADELRREGAAV